MLLRFVVFFYGPSPSPYPFFLVALIFIFCGLGRIDFLRFVISFFPIFPLYGQDGCVLLSTLFDEPLLVSLVSMLSVSLSLSLYPVRHLNGWIDSVLPFFGSFSDGVSVISPPSPPTHALYLLIFTLN